MLRALSFLTALAGSGVLLLAPFLVIHQMTPRVHAVLPILLFGVAGLFAYGIGFVPRSAVWRKVLSPWLSWPIVIIAAYALAL